MKNNKMLIKEMDNVSSILHQGNVFYPASEEVMLFS